MRPRLLQLMTGLVVALAALTACRREVPTPPAPIPDKEPRPSVSTAYAAAWLGR